jgi:hypothetical protein
MKRLLFSIAVVSMAAQEPADFQSPQAYPATRYEAIWNKNPFTLKTAPSAVARPSFAQDFVIVTHYGAVDDPVIVIANTKTQERITLKKGRPSDGGIALEVANIGVNRKETFVQVTLAGETARLRYDEDYLRRMAAAAQPKQTPQPLKPANGAASPPSRTLQSSTIKLPALPQ